MHKLNNDLSKIHLLDYANAVSIKQSLARINGVYTAQKSGALEIYGVKDNDAISSSWIVSKTNEFYTNNLFFVYRPSNSVVLYQTYQLQVSKGDVLKCTEFTNIYTSCIINFIPYK